MTRTELSTTLIGIFAATPIYGARLTAEDIGEQCMRIARAPRSFGYRIGDVTLSWDQGWGIICALRITLTHPDKQDSKRVEVTGDISWSSTGRSVEQAVAAIHLYTQVTQLAALVQSALAGVEITEEAPAP